MAWTGSSLVVWLVILAIGVGTFAIRLSFIELFGRIDDVPPRVERALRYVPPAVLAALVAPQLVIADGAVALHPANGRLLAGTIAAIVSWRTENLVLTLLAGMAAIWAFEYLA
jgi:branched-subunit amino acid transport protein